MAKTFAPRVSKGQRKTITLNDRFEKDIFRLSDQKLLQGAKLDEVRLSDIKVKGQVRTKFNDNSLKELSENIRTNGLIQPLVLHKEKGHLVLICGERRFRAMNLIEMEKAPCFVLDNKSADELMAIQFSENSSREALHYIDKADGILNYQKATKASERKIQVALGISKSEVHRSLIIAKLAKKIKEAAKIYNIEKYVLIELAAMDTGSDKKKMEKRIIDGEISKRAQFKRALTKGVVGQGSKIKKTLPPVPSLSKTSANAFLKAMNSVSKDMNLDKKSAKLLKELLSETRNVLE